MSGRQLLLINLPKNQILIGWGIQTTQSWEGPTRWSNQGPYLLIWNWRCRVERGTPRNTGHPTTCRVSRQYSLSWDSKPYQQAIQLHQHSRNQLHQRRGRTLPPVPRFPLVLHLPHWEDQPNLQEASCLGGTLPWEYKSCWDVSLRSGICIHRWRSLSVCLNV